MLTISAAQNVVRFFRGIRKVSQWSISKMLMRKLKREIRDWLEVPKTVFLSQEEYDQLSEKEEGTLYMTSEEGE